jgi:hypothetical protein
MIKVIATLLRNSPDNIHLYDIKSRFLDDMILLASASRENRRIILHLLLLMIIHRTINKPK